MDPDNDDALDNGDDNALDNSSEGAARSTEDPAEDDAPVIIESPGKALGISFVGGSLGVLDHTLLHFYFLLFYP